METVYFLKGHKTVYLLAKYTILGSLYVSGKNWEISDGRHFAFESIESFGCFFKEILF